MAPKIIHKIPPVITSPCKLEARILLKLTPQKKKAIRTVIKNVKGIAYFAGKRKPINITPARIIGKKAKIE